MSSPSASRPARPITLDELVLLNEELRALLSAGIPLEVGLQGSSARLGGRLGRLTERLAMRIEQGTTLEAALGEEQHNLPAEYRAVMAAGIRSGRFDAVLASVTRFAAAMRELHSHITRALVYPLAVLAIAWLLFVGVVWVLAPTLVRTFEVFRMEPGWWLTALSRLQSTALIWGTAVPAVVLAAIVGPWLWRKLSGAGAQGGWRPGIVGVIPGIRGVVRNAQLARFAHLLSILAEHRVPLPEAVRLSASATGSGRLVETMETAARDLEGGQPLQQALPEGRVPAFLKWLMVTGEQQSSLPDMLRQAAEVYQQRATIRAEWIQRCLPVVLVLVLGGSATVLYALTVFVPMASLWKNLGG